MPAVVNTDVFDAALAELATATTLVLCSQEPETYAEANATYALARVSLTPGDGNGDFVIEAGDGPAGSRKLTMAAQTVTGEDDGLATHFALIRTGDTTLLHRNSVTNVGIEDTVPQDVNEVRVLEILQPS